MPHIKWSKVAWSGGILLLLTGGAFIYLVIRAEWYFHPVAQQDFFDAPDSRHPVRLTAEVRRRYPWHDWRSLLRQAPEIYLQYEMRIRWEDSVLTSAQFGFADDPRPVFKSIETKRLDDGQQEVLFNFDGEQISCTFEAGAMFHWRNEQAFRYRPQER